ncbi:MAG: hypothetical protein KBE65_19600 [Phycisphaerae bacterium]|nr:hypothetical protein [Phycisphaerae bacterium]
MTPASLLLKVYYEQLHDRMETHRSRLLRRIDELLAEEIEKRGFTGVEGERLSAYRETCEAFIDERLETYNPIGIQYTFGNTPSRTAADLEFQLNWYDSRPEFADLVAAARALAEEDASDARLNDLAADLIRRVGAFPDRSIVGAYRAQPSLQKLPDYIVALAIEEIACERKPTF